MKFSIKKTAQIAVQHFLCGSQPASYSVDVGDSVLAGKAAEA
jgi:hypothetical protein